VASRIFNANALPEKAICGSDKSCEGEHPRRYRLNAGTKAGRRFDASALPKKATGSRSEMEIIQLRR
jgi:hypothetical protein